MWVHACVRSTLHFPGMVNHSSEYGRTQSGTREGVQGFDKVVPPFQALLKFLGGEGFEEVVPLSKTHRNSACLKG